MPQQLEFDSPKLMVKGWIPPKLERNFTVVGRSFNRTNGFEKVTGKAKYAGDIKFPDMLHAKILRSPHAHARIKSIDISKAEAVPGVMAILTKDNTKEWYTQWYDIAQPALPEVVSYVGEEIAVVAAETIDAARKALQLIQVEYETLPFVLDSEEALKPSAPEVTVSDLMSESHYGSHAPKLGNVWEGKPTVYDRGNMEQGFKDADLILERKYKTPFQHHGTLQTRTCVATWDGDTLTVYESCQGVWNAKLNLAKSLGLPVEKVRVIVKYQGGGFGSKAGAHRSITYAAKLSIITKRPVRIELTRAEEFISHPRRMSSTIYIKTGVKNDGRLTAIQCKGIVNVGSGGGYGAFTYDIIQHPVLLYNCPNMHLEQIGVYTNLQHTGPARSPLNVAGVSAFEAHMDEVAELLGIDPLEFRFKNYSYYSDPTKKTPFSAKNLDRAMAEVTKAIGWERRTKYAIDRTKEGHKKKGIGMGIYVFHGVGLPPFEANASVEIDRDGAVKLIAAVVDIGTGSPTALSQIAAEELGVSLEDIQISYGDTEGAPYSPGSHASRIIPEMGPAVLQAAAKARESLFQLVADYFKVDAQRLQSAMGWIYLKDDHARRVSFKEACKLLPQGETIKTTGSRAPNVGSAPYSLWTNKDAKVTHATFGATAVEVEVDVETGEVRVIRAATAHEFGRTLNPKFCDSQHYGGLVFGIGYGLLEEAVTDKKTGVMLNTDFHQYRMATSLDMPETSIPINIEAEDGYFAYSSKGGGEGINSAVPAAIRNAIYNATGLWLYEYPITPGRLISEIRTRSKDQVQEVLAQ